MPYVQDTSASLCFRSQQIFLHNARGWFGDVPLEASGDFGIHPEEGEFHVMCQVFSFMDAIMQNFRRYRSGSYGLYVWVEAMDCMYGHGFFFW